MREVRRLMDRLYFIVNPISGSGRGRRDFARVEALLRARGVAYEAAYTEHPRHAIALAQAALAAGERCIVAVGGDGTVNEVASVLVNTGVTMGVLPFGTGNDLARVAGRSGVSRGSAACGLHAPHGCRHGKRPFFPQRFGVWV